MPLKVKLLASFFLIGVALLIATAYSVSSAAKQHSMNLLIENMEISQSVVFSHINDTVNVIENAANNLTSDFNVKSLILNVESDPMSLKVALRNFSDRFETSEFALTDAHGSVTVASDNFSLPSIESIDLDANEQSVWLSMNDTYYLNIIVAVKNTPRSRSPMAYLVFSKKLSDVFNTRLAELSSFEVNAITRHDNGLSAHSTSGMDEQELLDIFKQQMAITEQIASTSIADKVYFSSIDSLDNINHRVWLMLVTPKSSAFLSIRTLFTELSALLMLATVLVGLFALYISNRISSPILSLSELTTKIGQGEDIDIPIGSTREVNKLARAMFTMNLQLNTRNKEIQTLAFEDDLTSLPNKNALIRRLDRVFDDKNSDQLALILLDIAKFTDLNEAIGYQAADNLLQQIAKRLSLHLGNNVFLARMTGNQFAIIRKEADAITDFIADIVDCIHKPFKVDKLNLGLTAKVGYAIKDRQINDSRRLTQAAEIALKAAKQGHNPSVKYESSLYLFDTRKLRLMSEISDITDNGQLSLYYQPQLNLQTKTVDSVECLARWIHPEEGFVPPDLFIGLAEQTGDIKKITRWVIKEAIQQHNQWKQLGFNLQMSANISAIDLADESFVSFITQLLLQYKMDASYLMLELTESTAMEEPENAIEALLNLSNIGVKLSIDDFGTGYSSMAQLKKMPVNELKIDKAFILELSKNTEDQNMVKTFISLAKTMDLKTVAEGVEDQKSLQLLTSFGCTHGQGYFISRPMDSRSTTKWFSSAEHNIQRLDTEFS
ncbi:MAG: EAL domain-containing protein [Pseudomonadota bacterium]